MNKMAKIIELTLFIFVSIHKKIFIFQTTLEIRVISQVSYRALRSCGNVEKD